MEMRGQRARVFLRRVVMFCEEATFRGKARTFILQIWHPSARNLHLEDRLIRSHGSPAWRDPSAGECSSRALIVLPIHGRTKKTVRAGAPRPSVAEAKLLSRDRASQKSNDPSHPAREIRPEYACKQAVKMDILLTFRHTLIPQIWCILRCVDVREYK